MKSIEYRIQFITIVLFFILNIAIGLLLIYTKNPTPWIIINYVYFFLAWILVFPHMHIFFPSPGKPWYLSHGKQIRIHYTYFQIAFGLLLLLFLCYAFHDRHPVAYMICTGILVILSIIVLMWMSIRTKKISARK